MSDIDGLEELRKDVLFESKTSVGSEYGIYAALTAPGQKISLGHQGWVGGRGTWEGKVEVGLLGLATAVEMVRVGGDSESCGLGMAVTNVTGRSAMPKSVAQFILYVLSED